MNKRENDIKYLLYLKDKLLKQTKKDIKALNRELDEIQDKKYVKKRGSR